MSFPSSVKEFFFPDSPENFSFPNITAVVR